MSGKERNVKKKFGFRRETGQRVRIRRMTVGLLALLLLASACAPAVKETVELMTPVVIGESQARVRYEESSVVLYENGYVAAEETCLDIPVSGMIREILVQPGDTVKKGDVLLVMERPDNTIAEETIRLQYRKQVDTLSTQLEQLQVEQLRAKAEAIEDPWEKELALLDAARAELEAKQAGENRKAQIAWSETKLAGQQREQNKTRLTAPIDGVVTWVAEDMLIGTEAKETEEVIAIADPTQLYVKVYALNRAQVTETGDGMEKHTTVRVPGSIARSRLEKCQILYCQAGDQRYALQYDTETEQRDILRLEFAGEERPEAGTGVMICGETETAERQLTVPKAAVFKESGVSYVYRVQGEERILTEVTTGAANVSSNIEILSGLEENDVVSIKTAQLFQPSADDSAAEAQAVCGSVVCQEKTSGKVLNRLIAQIVYRGTETATAVERSMDSSGVVLHKGDVVLRMNKAGGSRAELERRRLAYEAAVQEADSQRQQYDLAIQNWRTKEQNGEAGAALERRRLEAERALREVEAQEEIRQRQNEWKAYNQTYFSETVLTAPCDGVTNLTGGIWVVAEGAVVPNNKTIANLADRREYAVQKWDRAYFENIYAYPLARVILQQDGKEYGGRVYSYAPDRNTSGEIVERDVWILPDEESAVLGASFSILREWLKLDGVLTVPVDAVQEEDGETFVYIRENGSLYRQNVFCGPKDRDRVCILAGLSEGQAVVIP